MNLHASSHFWHGFTDMSLISRGEPLSLVRGEGEYLFDQRGKKYLDASAGLWNANVGHGREEIAQAAYQQLRTMETYSTFGDFTNEPVEELASRIAHLVPVPDAKTFFTSGGSDCTDTAIKLVRRYWEVMRKPDKRIIVSRSFAYHGSHMGSTALGGIDLDREGYGELITDTAQIEWDQAQQLQRTIEQFGADRVAAFVCEPVIAAGGCLFPPQGYLQKVEEICRANDVLLIVDEVVTGYGRIGDWFGSTRFGISPDLMITAKGLTSGYAPMGALVVGERVSGPFFNGKAGGWYHGYTSSGHATSAAIAIANLDIIEREALIENAQNLEQQIPSLMKSIAQHDAVSEVRVGEGLMAAVWLDSDAIEQDPDRARNIVQIMRREGVLTRPLVNGQIQFSPPLTSGPQQIQEFVDALAIGLEETEKYGVS